MTYLQKPEIQTTLILLWPLEGIDYWGQTFLFELEYTVQLSIDIFTELITAFQTLWQLQRQLIYFQHVLPENEWKYLYSSVSQLLNLRFLGTVDRCSLSFYEQKQPFTHNNLITFWLTPSKLPFLILLWLARNCPFSPNPCITGCYRKLFKVQQCGESQTHTCEDRFGALLVTFSDLCAMYL